MGRSLFAAVRSGKLERVHAAIQSGADVNEQREIDLDIYTPLSFAAGCTDNPDIIKALVDAGADLDQPREGGYSPLQAAADSNCYRAVGALLAAGADVNQACNNGETALILAHRGEANHKLVKALLDAGADVNARDYMEHTPLLASAAFSGLSEQVIHVLLAAGADVNARDFESRTALNCASVRSKRAEVIEALLHAGADVEARDRHGETPLMSAAGFNTQAVITVLLDAAADINASDQHGLTPLMHAARRSKDAGVIDLLLRRGADATARAHGGLTALMLAASDNANPEVLSALLAHGGDVNARAEDGLTALMLAARHNENPEVIAALIDAGADSNAQDHNGLTPLLCAAWGTSQPRIITTLLEAGADVNARAHLGWTALMLAAGFNRLAQVTVLLTGAGADVNEAAADGGWTPLMFAARFNTDAAVYGALLDAGADQTAQDVNGRTASDHGRHNEYFRLDGYGSAAGLSRQFQDTQREAAAELGAVTPVSRRSAYDRVVAQLKRNCPPWAARGLADALYAFKAGRPAAEKAFSKLVEVYLDRIGPVTEGEKQQMQEYLERQGLASYPASQLMSAFSDEDPKYDTVSELLRWLSRTWPWIPPVETGEPPPRTKELLKEFEPDHPMFFQWDDVDAARADADLQAGKDIELTIEEFGSEVSCPQCGKTGTELCWFFFRSPQWTWRESCGRAGWMAVCDDCNYQVFFKRTIIS